MIVKCQSCGHEMGCSRNLHNEALTFEAMLKHEQGCEIKQSLKKELESTIYRYTSNDRLVSGCVAEIFELFEKYYIKLIAEKGK